MRVNDREQLIYLLTEAAEIEHGLMCCYLYAAWSLKVSVDEGVSPEQLIRVDAWRKRIHGVAMEEMLHLALVNNILMSIGSPPHFSRQNFPVPAGYHPAHLVIKLRACTRDTLAHFIYLERPEGMELPQAAGFETELHYARGAAGVKLTPNAEDYATVGQLYSGIEDGLRHLASQLEEQTLFSGPPHAQVDASLLSFDGIQAVTDLGSALAAVATIVEQGEGGREDRQKSHYAEFCAMAAEYDELLSADPNFVPHRLLAPSPVIFPPLPDMDVTHVTAAEAVQTLDLSNACYGLMLRLLASGSGASYDDKTRKYQIDAAVRVMSVVKTLSTTLTSFPANNNGTGAASMNFHLPRSTLALPHREGALALLSERAKELAAAARDLKWHKEADSESIAVSLHELGEELARLSLAGTAANNGVSQHS